MQSTTPQRVNVINPDAVPYSSSAGVGGAGVPQGNTPATILSTGLAQTMGVPVGTVVPSGTVVTPAASAGSGGVTTIVTPPVGKSPQTVTTVTTSPSGTVTSVGVTGTVVTTPSGQSNSGVININQSAVDSKGQAIPPTNNSDGSINFTPTGNVPTDLAALSKMGASPAVIAAYMSLYGQGWNYNIASQGMSQNVPNGVSPTGQLLTKNTPGMSQAEAIAVQILNNAGITQKTVSQGYYVFTNQSTGQQVRIPSSVYDSSTPQQQFSLQQSLGNIPENATIQINPDGAWTYSTGAVYTSVPAFTKPLLDYLRTNDPDVYAYVQQNGIVAAMNKYGGIINGAVSVLNAQGVTVSGSPGLSVGGIQSQLNLQTTISQMPQDLQNVYYQVMNKGGNQQTALNAVQTSAQQTISTFAQNQNVKITSASNPTQRDVDNLIAAGINPTYLSVIGVTNAMINTGMVYNFVTNTLPSAPTVLQKAYYQAGGGLQGIAAYNQALPQYYLSLASAITALGNYATYNVTGVFDAQHPAPAGSITGYNTQKYLADNNYSTQAQANINLIYGSTMPNLASSLVAMRGMNPITYLIQNPTDSGKAVVQGAGYNVNNLGVVNGKSVTADEIISNYQAAIKDINVNVLLNNKPMSGQIESLLDAIQQNGFYNVGLNGRAGSVTDNMGNTTYLFFGNGKTALTDQQIATIQWNNLTDTQKAQVASTYSQDKYNKNYFGEYYKQEVEAAQEAGTFGSFVFALPITIERPYAEKAVGLKTTPMEWLLSSATIATLAAPAIPKILEAFMPAIGIAVPTEGGLGGVIIRAVPEASGLSGMSLTAAGEGMNYYAMSGDVVASQLGTRIVLLTDVASFGVYSTAYAQAWNQMSPAQRAVYGSMLVAPFAIEFGGNELVKYVGSSIDSQLKNSLHSAFPNSFVDPGGYTLDSQSLALMTGIPNVEVPPGVSETKALDLARTMQRAVPTAAADIVTFEGAGRITPLNRASVIMNTPQRYESTSQSLNLYDKNTITWVKNYNQTFGNLDLPDLPSDIINRVTPSFSNIGKLINNANIRFATNPDGTTAMTYINNQNTDVTVNVDSPTANKVQWFQGSPLPAKIVDVVPQKGNPVSSTAEFVSQSAWVGRGADVGNREVIELHANPKEKTYTDILTLADKLNQGQGFTPSTVDGMTIPNAVKMMQTYLDSHNFAAYQKLWAKLDAVVDSNGIPIFANQEFPPFRWWAPSEGQSYQWLEPEGLRGTGTKDYIIDKAFVRAPDNVYSRVLATSKDIKTPIGFDSLNNEKQIDWYHAHNIKSPAEIDAIEAEKPAGFSSMSPQQKAQWYYDNNPVIQRMKSENLADIEMVKKLGLPLVDENGEFYKSQQITNQMRNANPTDLQTNERLWYMTHNALPPAESDAVAQAVISNPKWNTMSVKQQNEFLHDYGGAIKVISEGSRQPIIVTSTDPNALPISKQLVELTSLEEFATRLRRMAQLPKAQVTLESGEVSKLPALEIIKTNIRPEGQNHVSVYPQDFTNVKIIDGQYNGKSNIFLSDLHGNKDATTLITEATNLALDRSTNPATANEPPAITKVGGIIRVNVLPGDSWTINMVGDAADRGINPAASLTLWRQLLRLQQQVAEASAEVGATAKVNLILGNHDLAHITKQPIEGIDYSNKSLEKVVSKLLKRAILDGKIVAAASPEGTSYLATHAGASAEVFPEYNSKPAGEIATDLNKRLVTAMQNNDFKSDKALFNRGKLDGRTGVGGIFWYRPGESPAGKNVLPGVTQIVGHTPAPVRGGTNWSVTDRSGFITVDSATWWTPGNKDLRTVFYADSPTLKSVRLGSVLLQPGQSVQSITLPLSGDAQSSLADIRNTVKTTMGGNIKLNDIDNIGLTVSVPANIDQSALSKFTAALKQAMVDTPGQLNYQFVSGYPGNYNPAVLYLNLRDDASVDYLHALQIKINDIAKSLGYNEGDFKAQAGMTLGEVVNRSDPTNPSKLLDVLRDPKNTVEVNTNPNEYLEPVKTADGTLVVKANQPIPIASTGLVESANIQPSRYDSNDSGRRGKLSINRSYDVLELEEAPEKKVDAPDSADVGKSGSRYLPSERLYGVKEGIVSEVIATDDKTLSDKLGYKPTSYSEGYGVKGEAKTEEKIIAEPTPKELISYGGQEVPAPYGGEAPSPIYAAKYNPPYNPPYKPPPPQSPYTESITKVVIPGKSSSPSGALEARRQAFRGSIGWKQGFGYWFIKSPYSRKSDIAFFREPPDGAEIVSGVGAAYRSIKLITGSPPPRELLIPLGIMTIRVKRPEAKAGKKGAIAYKMNRAAKRGKKTGSVRIVA
jgi:2'-5' RNA ligase